MTYRQELKQDIHACEEMRNKLKTNRTLASMKARRALKARLAVLRDDLQRDRAEDPVLAGKEGSP
jgi:hypothetical protein